jgi:hypothetical protein
MDGSFRISLAYLQDLPLYEKEKPYEIWVSGAKGVPKTNCEFHECKNIPLYDVREHDNLNDFNLNTTGFKFLTHTTRCLPDPNIFQQPGQENSMVPYLDETAQLVKEIMAAKKVLAYDWRVSFENGPSKRSH